MIANCVARRRWARLRAVMSRAIVDTPVIRPAVSRTGETWRDTSMRWPSLATRTVS